MVGTGSPRTVYRKMALVKSLFTYANEIGYLLFNVGVVIDLQHPDDNRNQKILPEDEIIKLINATDSTILIVLKIPVVGLNSWEIQVQG